MALDSPHIRKELIKGVLADIDGWQNILVRDFSDEYASPEPFALECGGRLTPDVTARDEHGRLHVFLVEPSPNAVDGYGAPMERLPQFKAYALKHPDASYYVYVYDISARNAAYRIVGPPLPGSRPPVEVRALCHS